MSTAAIVSLEGLRGAPQLRVGDQPAPFVPIAGVELVTRQILGLLQHGIEQLIVVPGRYRSEFSGLVGINRRLREAPFDTADNLKDAVRRVVDNPNTERVIVVGGDVHFGPGWVRFAEEWTGEPVACSQEIEFFVARPSALRDSGDPAAALVRARPLAGEERPAEKDAYIRRITDRSDVRAAKSAIFANVTKATSGWVSKNINAKLSLPISRFLSEFPVTPNQITLFTTVLGLSAGPLIGLGSYAGVFWGGLMFQLAAAFDRCDGELARSKFMASPLGEWIDTIGDNLSYLVFIIGLTIGTYNRTGSDIVLWAGFGLLAALIFLLLFLYRYLLKHTKSGSLVAVYMDMEKKYEKGGRPPAYKILNRIRWMGKRDFFSLAVFVFCAFNLLEVLFVATCITLTLIITYMLSGASRLPKASGQEEAGRAG